MMVDISEIPGNIRPMVDDDLMLVLNWRNASKIRKLMYNQKKISYQDHQDWFKSSKSDNLRHLLIVERDKVAFGFVSIQELIPGRTAKWGFYTSPDAESKSGSLLALLALSYAFSKLKLHKLSSEVLAYNDKSIRFHTRQGFKQEGMLREQYFDGKKYQSIVCFGLLNSEWQLIAEGM